MRSRLPMLGRNRLAQWRNAHAAIPRDEFGRPSAGRALDDGRLLAQSNAILRYLARGSGLIPQDAYRAGEDGRVAVLGTV